MDAKRKPSKAQAAAVEKYRKANSKTFLVRFYNEDMELYEHIQRQPEGSRQKYIRELIREDMEHQQHE